MKYLKILLALVLFSIETQAQNVNDFTLTSVTDKSTFTLSKSKGKFVAIHFLLKTECPYCIRHTSEYFEKASSLPNVVQVFIKPDSEDEIKTWANKLKSTNNLPIYQDVDAKLADQFKIPNGYQFHGQVVHYPALILLNEKGEEVFRYIGKNNSDRFSFDQLKSKIEELNNHKKSNTKMNPNEIFPQGNPLPQEWFTGKTFLHPMIAKDSNNNFSAGAVTFEPKARTHWHIHPKGQVLIVIDGNGFYQLKGKPAQSIKKGDVINIPENTEHWHGANSKVKMVHIAITNYKDEIQVTWLQPVTDDEYNNAIQQ